MDIRQWCFDKYLNILNKDDILGHFGNKTRSVIWVSIT